MPNLRNLALRPPKPALGNGHVQRLAKQALLMLDRDATTREVLDWTCSRKLLLLKRPLALHAIDMTATRGQCPLHLQ